MNTNTSHTRRSILLVVDRAERDAVSYALSVYRPSGATMAGAAADLRKQFRSHACGAVPISSLDAVILTTVLQDGEDHAARQIEANPAGSGRAAAALASMRTVSCRLSPFVIAWPFLSYARN